jgi:hypothetical protein
MLPRRRGSRAGLSGGSYFPVSSIDVMLAQLVANND